MATNDEIIKEMRKKENDGETFYNVLDDALDKARKEGENNYRNSLIKKIDSLKASLGYQYNYEIDKCFGYLELEVMEKKKEE